MIDESGGRNRKAGKITTCIGRRGVGAILPRLLELRPLVLAIRSAAFSNRLVLIRQTELVRRLVRKSGYPESES